MITTGPMQAIPRIERRAAWRVCLCGLLLLLLTLPGRAQAPSPAVRCVTLPDGVRLLLKPEPDTEVTAIVAFVRTEPEPDPDPAAAELVARALFFGSLNRSMDRISRSITQVGGLLETLRTPDYVAVTCVTVGEQLNEAAYLICEALKNADFAPEALDRARQSLLDERRERADDGFETARADLCARLSGASEPGQLALRRVTQERAQDYFQRHYVPARTVIAVVGRFQPDAAQRAFDADLYDYDHPAPRARAITTAPQKPNFNAETQTFLTSGGVAYALVGVPAPDVTSPDYPAFTVLQTLLGGGHAARLFRRVRDTLGLGYEVGATYRADRADPLIAYLQWDTRRALPGPAMAALKPEEALKLLQVQLDALLADPPTEAELTRARNYAIGRDALRHERARDRAFLLGWYETMGLGYAFDAEFPRRLAAVTRADVLRVAHTYLAARATALALPKSN
ncbi:MAG TPA: pitrilysin family protein [Chthonomonadaceae bacterium]|nr:pitrilysin family protein [Chthonomonadaceae bacterium]